MSIHVHFSTSSFVFILLAKLQVSWFIFCYEIFHSIGCLKETTMLYYTYMYVLPNVYSWDGEKNLTCEPKSRDCIAAHTHAHTHTMYIHRLYSHTFFVPASNFNLLWPLLSLHRQKLTRRKAGGGGGRRPTMVRRGVSCGRLLSTPRLSPPPTALLPRRAVIYQY